MHFYIKKKYEDSILLLSSIKLDTKLNCMTYLIIDTNVCLHFKSIDEYPWKEHLDGNEKITIVFTYPLLAEVDSKKYDRKNHIKKRAIKTVKLIQQVDNLEPRNGCKMLFYNTAINGSDIESLGLDVKDADDKLLAALLKFRDDYKNETIFLVSNDLGPRMKAKTFGIDSIIPFEKHLLEDPDDELVKKIKQLQLENEKLKNKIPRLSVTFNDGERKANYKIELKLIDNEEFIDYHMNLIKKEHQRYKLKIEIEKERETETETENSKKKESVQKLDTISPFKQAIERLQQSGGYLGISEEEKVKYNSELLLFYNEYKNYLQQLISYKKIDSLTIEIDLKLSNIGTTPAEDIDVYFHFQDGFELFDEENYPAGPSEPQAPYKRTSVYDFPTMNHNLSEISSRLERLTNLNSNVSSPTINKTNSYDVNIHVTKLKHNQSELLDRMYIVFDSYDSLISFSIDYELRCSNIPYVVKDKLNFIIKAQPNNRL